MARKIKEIKSEALNLKSNQAIELDQTGDSNVMTDENSGAYNQRSRCGGALRTARESQGLSIQDIASRLRLGPKQIEALETDNFAVLPEATIIRGFIRNYAKQLKINAEPLLNAYNVLVPNSDLHRPIVRPNANMKISSYKKPKLGRYLFIIVSALLGLSVWFFYQNYVAKPVAKPFANSDALSVGVIGENASNEKTMPLPEAALPAAERESSLQTSTELTLPAAPEAATAVSPTDANAVNAATTANLPAPTLSASTLPATTLPDLPTNAANLPASAPVGSAVPPAVVANASSVTKLEFNATQETWIQVLDASGHQIYNKIIFAGSRESIDVTPPVNITVGNAGATSLSMNGKPVELAPHTRQNVARIKLK